MIGRLGHPMFRSRRWRVLRWAGLAAALPALWACTSRSLEAPASTPTQVFGTTVTEKINREMDLLFMIDDSSSMKGMQQQLYEQLPLFIETLQSKTDGSLPSLHIAVVSSDMGAPSNVILPGCSATGDAGAFHVMAEGACMGTTLNAGAEYISNDNGMPNFTQANMGTEPGMAIVFQCISLLGDQGCGFEHQLASIDRALGADGSPAPSTNQNFLRPEAYLGIVLLTNEDDCSAPANTNLFSLNGQYNGLDDPNGPIANYRCNGGPEGGHLCTDPNGNQVIPPLTPPPPATAGVTETFTNCVSNENSALIPVAQFVKDIKSLKPDPDNQILVAAIAGPVDKAHGAAIDYTVQWEPGTGSTQAQGELWPSIEHSCGTENADQSGIFADPGVRITQFVEQFGKNGVLASICDASYAPSMTTIAKDLDALITPKCLPGNLQTYTDAAGNTYPNCTVADNVTDTTGITTSIPLPNCKVAAAGAPCWQLVADTTGACPAGTSQTLQLMNDTANMSAAGLNSTIQCSTCPAGVKLAGCP